LQVQEVVLRLGALQGLRPCTPQGNIIPLTPFEGDFFFEPLSEGVQRGFAPLQVQEVVLRLGALQGLRPCTPQGDVIPLTSFEGDFFF
jgi:hypothetical protein